MTLSVGKLRVSGGVSQLLHFLLTALLPALLFVLVKTGFYQAAFIVLALSKWRMFAVRPHYWIANIKANAVDIIVGVSIIIFMMYNYQTSYQLLWAGLYLIWLTLIKPGSGTLLVSLQALSAQVLGLMSLFLNFPNGSLWLFVIVSWLICFSAARHFFTSFEEPHSDFFALTWGYIGAATSWLLGHWLLYYGIISQPTLLLSVIGFGIGTIYYLEKNDRLSKLLLRQFLFIIVAIIVIVLTFSDWGDKAI